MIENNWKLVPVKPGVNSIHNLHVFSRDGVEVGFIEKPRDSRTDKNFWRAFHGIGEQARFLEHAETKAAAMLMVEHAVGDPLVSFKVVAVSSKPNSFGLHGHVLIAEDGRAFEVARYRGPGCNPEWNKGDVVIVSPRNWAAYGCEIPRELPKAPAAVAREVWGKPVSLAAVVAEISG